MRDATKELIKDNPNLKGAELFKRGAELAHKIIDSGRYAKKEPAKTTEKKSDVTSADITSTKSGAQIQHHLSSSNTPKTTPCQNTCSDVHSQ